MSDIFLCLLICMHISFTLYLHQEKNIKDINKNMKSLEVKAAEYVYASIADGYFSKEVKNGNEVIFVSGRYDKYDNEVVIDEAYLLNLETEESTELDTCMIEEYLNGVLAA